MTLAATQLPERARSIDQLRANLRSQSSSQLRHTTPQTMQKMTPITAFFSTNPDLYFYHLVVHGDPKLAPLLQQLPSIKYELLNRTVNVTDILKQLNALETFFFVEGVPDVHIQAAVGGSGKERTLYLTVFRGAVESFRKTRHYGYQTYILRDYDQKMGQMPDFAKRYYYYALANQLTGITTETYLEPTQTPGVYDFNTIGHLKRMGGFIGMNNTGIQPLGHMIYSMNGYVNGIIGDDQLESGGSFTSKTNKGQFFYTTYRIGLGSHGTQLLTSFAYNKMQLGETVIYKFQGQGKAFTLELDQPFMITPKTFLRMILGYALQRGKTRAGVFSDPNILLVLFRNSTVKETVPTIYAQLGFSHLYTLGRVWGNVTTTAWGHFLERAAYSVEGGLFSQDGLTGQTTSLARKPKLTGAKASYDYNQIVIMPHDFSLYLASRGQFSFRQQIPLALKFGFFDGAFIGQGFVADSGVSGRTELRWDWNVYNPYFKKVQFFTYYALGYLQNLDPLFTPYKRAEPMTAGFGLRTNFLEKMDGFIEFAKPIRRKPTINESSAWRFFFGLGLRV